MQIPEGFEVETNSNQEVSQPQAMPEGFEVDVQATQQAQNISNQQQPIINTQQPQFQQDNNITPQINNDFNTSVATQQQPMQRPQSDAGFFDYLKNQYDQYVQRPLDDFKQQPLDTPLKKVGGAMLASMTSTPREGANQIQEGAEYAQSDVGKAMSMKASKDNLEFEFGDLKKMIDSGLGDANATAQVQQKKDKLYTSLAKTLNDNDVEAFYKDGKIQIVTTGEDGKEKIIDLDENTMSTIGHGFLASGGEIAGGIGGAGTAAVAANRMMPPMATPIQRGVATTVAGLAGGYAGSTGGAVVDLIRDSLVLGKEIDGMDILSKATARGVADVTGATGMATVGKGISKGIIEPLKALSDRAWTLYKTGDIRGAVQVLKDDYDLTDEGIDAIFESVKKDIDGYDDLEGDDLLRAKLLAVVQQQSQGEGLISAAIERTPKGAMKTSQEIESRADEVLKSVQGKSNKASDIRADIGTYEQKVKDNYGEVKALINEASPNYKPTLDINSFKSTLDDVGNRVVDPQIKEKIINLSEVLANQPNRNIDDLIETRKLYNDFYGRNAKHFNNKNDKDALRGIIDTIDAEIDRGIDSIDGGTVSKQLKDSFTDAKSQYHEMFNTQDSKAYSNIFKEGADESDIAKGLTKYSRAVDGNLDNVLNKLPQEQRTKAEFSVISDILNDSMGSTKAKSIDFNGLLEKIDKSKGVLKSEEAQQFIKNIESFNKKFGQDVGLQKATEGVVSKEMNSIATSVIGKTKMMIAGIQFKAIQRLAMSEEGRRLSLQKSLEMAIQKSRTSKEFLIKASKIKGMPDTERQALKQAVKEIGEQEQIIKKEAFETQKKNKASVEQAKTTQQQSK